MCIYIIYYYSPFLYINVALYTKKGGNLTPVPCLTVGWDISSCPAFGLGLIPPAPLLLRPMDPAPGLYHQLSQVFSLRATDGGPPKDAYYCLYEVSVCHQLR